MALDITTFPIVTKKLSELVAIGAVDGLDVLYVLDISTGESRKMTINEVIALAPGGGITDLAVANNTALQLDVTSSTGTDATLSGATITLAGLLAGADKQKLEHISISQAFDADEVGDGLYDLVTLSGIPINSLNLGTFTGTTISDNVTVKVAFQELETAQEVIGAQVTINTGDIATNAGDIITNAGDILLNATNISNNAGAITTIEGDIVTIENDITNLQAEVQQGQVAPIDPDADNDSSEGYDIGSHWYNVIADTAYVCLDATVGAAVWKETTVQSTPSGFGSLSAGNTLIGFNGHYETLNTPNTFFSEDGDAIYVMAGGSTSSNITRRVFKWDKDLITGEITGTSGNTANAFVADAFVNETPVMDDLYIYVPQRVFVIGSLHSTSIHVYDKATMTLQATHATDMTDSTSSNKYVYFGGELYIHHAGNAEYKKYTISVGSISAGTVVSALPAGLSGTGTFSQELNGKIYNFTSASNEIEIFTLSGITFSLDTTFSPTFPGKDFNAVGTISDVPIAGCSSFTTDGVFNIGFNQLSARDQGTGDRFSNTLIIKQYSVL